RLTGLAVGVGAVGLLLHLGKERLHRTVPAVLVLGLVRVEPLLLLVLRELLEQGARRVGEALEAVGGFGHDSALLALFLHGRRLLHPGRRDGLGLGLLGEVGGRGVALVGG